MNSRHYAGEQRPVRVTRVEIVTARNVLWKQPKSTQLEVSDVNAKDAVSDFRFARHKER